MRLMAAPSSGSSIRELPFCKYAHTCATLTFVSWTESQLKAFLDYHSIPNPSPRTRDSLLHTARSNYQAAANKAGETAAYPGDWLYSQWSDSDLKAWFDERGVPVPQPGKRDQLISSLRRNSYVAAQQAKEQYNSAASSAKAATQSLSNQLLDSWNDNQIKEWLDKNGVPVPQGSKRNELVALARKHSAKLTGNNAHDSAASAYGAATSSAGNYYAQASDSAYGGFKQYYDYVMNQLGMASDEAKASISSASSVASASGSSLSSAASKSASSVSAAASKAGASASSSAQKAGKDGNAAASSAASSYSSSAGVAASSASKSASSSASSASSRAKEEL